MATASPGVTAEGGPDPAMVRLAERVAKDLVDCDSSILSLIAVDGVGRVLHVSRSSRLPSEERVDPQLVQVFGTIARVILGAANNAAQIMGGTEAVIGVYKRQKVLLVNLPAHEMLLAVRLVRSANAEYVCDKIGDLLAIRGQA